MRRRLALILCAVALAAPVTAAAEEATPVAIAPLSTLGEETTTKETRKVQALVEDAVGSVPGFTAVATRTLDRAVKKAKRRDLRACDGDNACLTELGKLVDAKIVVYGELGGLGEAQVVYLKAVDVASARELRSTTLELGSSSDRKESTRSAAFRLLAPDHYRGRLAVKVDVKGATIYVDGQAMGTSPKPPLPLSVGTHALRVTHPEYRDFVRFVDIRFDQETPVDVALSAYPIVERDIGATSDGKVPPGATVIYRGQEKLPWYRRWYTIAGGSAALLVGTAVVVGILANGLDVDRERPVSPAQ